MFIFISFLGFDTKVFQEDKMLDFKSEDLKRAQSFKVAGHSGNMSGKNKEKTNS